MFSINTVIQCIIILTNLNILICVNNDDNYEPVKRNAKKELLVSYLAAVSQFPKDLFDSIQHLSEVDSNETPDTNDTHYFNRLSQCFRTDFEGSMISGALQVAIEEINSNPNLLSDYELVYLFNNTCGSEKKSTEFFMDHWKQGAKVFIGPEMNCRTEATMAASQNLPIISYKCKDQTVSNKKKYPTFARTVPAETEITRALLSLLKHFDWHKFTIIYEKHSRNEELHNAIKKAIEHENHKIVDGNDEEFTIRNVSVIAYPFSEVEKSNVEQIITDTHTNTRVYLTFGNVRLFRRILLVMGALGLMDNGEYVLIYLDTDYNWHNVYHAMNNHFFRDTLIEVIDSWGKPDSADRQVVNFSKTALAIIPTPVKLDSNDFIDFWEKANNYLVNFGVQKHDTALSIKANRFACYLYDAVMLYAQALDELLKEVDATEDYDPLEDGTAIINKILGRKYTSMQGFDMRINENGDAQGNYTLLSLQSVIPVTNASDPDYYPLDSALMISADFIEVEDDTLPKLRFSRKINWPNELPPLDEPECGFQNEKCIKEDNWKFQLVMSLILLVVLVIFFASTAVVYRNKKFEQELSMIWRINPADLEKCVQCYTSTNSLYCMERSRNSLINDREDLSHKRFISRRGVARYKGTVVAIKEMSYLRKPREITRSTKLEMKAMRQLHHDNINSFIGIIIFPMSICVVREFCAKGSLNEILVMTDFKLDELFIASFMQDLIRGMIYLHESEVKVHGNLKSTNCLITSRWALQVADFGLHEIREGQEWESPELLWESYLWTAPELLRECELIHAVKGTQKGDVYSFGIILHEIMAREGPFHLCEHPHSTAEQVVRRVAEGSMYRPSTNTLTCNNYVIDTMTLCWSEVPEHRPDFRHGVRAKLKPMFDHISGKNIVEYMMDRYLQTLEELVEERTAQLRDEKRRTENLLQRMLPISVANQLIAGKDVEPESFPSVSIYFSDIVGFTTISGQSTPMQVVNFLNKLYTLFDSIIKQYEVYKVETIGDAYMVVSGVPKQHDEAFNADQIGTMALHLLSAVRNFRIPHRPDEQLKLRIGIHTGPVVAGIVGKTMPRYCLFGDTVNTASRMETYGESLKIHCSESFRKAVNSDMGFIFDERGELEVKGKGKMRTFWLKEKIGHSFTSDESEFSDDDLAPEIFPRASMKLNRGLLSSNWSVKTSSLSLQKEGISTKFLKRLVEKASAMTPSLTRNDTSKKPQNVFKFNKQKDDVIDCESQLTISTQTNPIYQGQSCSSISSTFPSNDQHFLMKSESNLVNSLNSTASTSMHPAIRKRSSSVPDGEVLKINHFNPHQLACTAPNSSIQTPLVAQRKNAMAINYEGTFDKVIDMKKNQEEMPAPRKRSLSCGNNANDGVITSNDIRDRRRSPLITPPTQKKRRFRKDRKSALSLQYNAENDIMAKKLIGHASMRERSPVTSFNRVWRRITMPTSEADGSASSVNNQVKGNLPLIPSKPINQDESLDRLLEETDNSTLNGSSNDSHEDE